MSTALSAQDQAQAIEQVVMTGNLAALTSTQRVAYYNRVCESVGLNPYTRPFDYVNLNGKLTLYAKRDAADQLRKLNGISLSKPSVEYVDDLVIVWVDATDQHGRTDSDCGAVSLAGKKGEDKANAIMKAITKAKRRVTLSISGLGWLDETEIDSVPGAQRVEVETVERIVDATTGEITESAPQLGLISKAQQAEYHALGNTFYGNKWDKERRRLNLATTTKARGKGNGIEHTADLYQSEAGLLISGLHKRVREMIALACKDHDLDIDAICESHSVEALEAASPVALTHIWKDVQGRIVPETQPDELEQEAALPF